MTLGGKWTYGKTCVAPKLSVEEHQESTQDEHSSTGAFRKRQRTQDVDSEPKCPLEFQESLQEATEEQHGVLEDPGEQDTSEKVGEIRTLF